MSASWTFMVRSCVLLWSTMLTNNQIWTQIAHLERPAWLVKRERELIDLLIRMAWAKDMENVWIMVLELAKRWALEDARSPPDAADEGFFKGRVEAEEDKLRQKAKDKKKRQKANKSAKAGADAEVCK